VLTFRPRFSLRATVQLGDLVAEYTNALLARGALRDECAATIYANARRSPRRRADVYGRRSGFWPTAVRVARVFLQSRCQTRRGASLRYQPPTVAFVFEHLEHLFLLGIFSDPLGPTVGRKRKEDDQRDH